MDADHPDDTEPVESDEKTDEEMTESESAEPSHYRNRLGQLIETRKISKEYSKSRENG